MRVFSIILLTVVMSPGVVAAQTLGDAKAPIPTDAGASDPLPFGLFISPAISTLGLGLEAGVRANEFVGVRLGGNYFAGDFDRSVNDVDYEAEARLASVGALVDVHPFRGGFRLSGGFRANFNQADLTGTPNDDITIGGQTFSSDEVGVIKGRASYGTFAPYLGLGYGATLLEGALTVGFDAGVMYQGAANVDLDAEDGLLEDDPVLEENLAIEEQEVEDDLDDFQFYPVIGLAVIYRF